MQQRKLYLLAIDRHILKELKCPTTTCFEVSTGSYFINFPNTRCEKRGSFCMCILPPHNWEFSIFAWQLRIPLHKRKEMLTELHSPTYSIMFLLEKIYLYSFLSLSDAFKQFVAPPFLGAWEQAAWMQPATRRSHTHNKVCEKRTKLCFTTFNNTEPRKQSINKVH